MTVHHAGQQAQHTAYRDIPIPVSTIAMTTLCFAYRFTAQRHGSGNHSLQGGQNSSLVVCWARCPA